MGRFSDNRLICKEDVDGRVKPGHDDVARRERESASALPFGALTVRSIANGSARSAALR